MKVWVRFGGATMGRNGSVPQIVSVVVLALRGFMKLVNVTSSESKMTAPKERLE